eukprot:SAG11_NODE_31489_length_291_cov_1.067708_1_plen_64_part_01
MSSRSCTDDESQLSVIGAPAGYTCAMIVTNPGCDALLQAGVGYLCGLTCGLDAVDCALPPSRPP